MSKRKLGAEILAGAFVTVAAIVGIYFDGKLLVTAFIHPLRIAERLLLPFFGILFIFWVIGKLQQRGIVGRLDGRPSDAGRRHL